MKFILNKKIYAYFSGVILISVLQGTAIGTNGVFLDTLYYYELYQLIEENGLLYTVTAIYTQSGKFEPIISVLFYIEGFLFGSIISESIFLIVNMVILNSFLSYCFFPSIKNNVKNSLLLLIITTIIISGYLVFSKGLWFWRSFLGLSFFLLLIKEKNIFYKLIYALLCCFSHTSYILFLLIYLLVNFAYKKGGILFFSILTIISLTFTLVANKFQGIFSFAVSNTDPTIFFSDGGSHTIIVWFSVFYSMIILLLLYKAAIKSDNRIIYLFCILCTIISLVSYNNYHFMNRVFLPTSLIIGFLPFTFSSHSINIKLAKIMILFSVIPGIRLIFNLFAGDFYA